MQEKIILPETREQKLREAEISVRNMFDKKMEATGTITSFEGQEERN